MCMHMIVFLIYGLDINTWTFYIPINFYSYRFINLGKILTYAKYLVARSF